MANEETRALPGLEELGCGYDATGLYANPKSKRARIFELGEMDTKVTAPNGIVYYRPKGLKFELGNLSQGSFHSMKGQTADEYRKSLTVRAGVSASYGLFSADVTTTFEEKQLASINHEFVKVHHRFDAWVISLPNYKSLKMDPEANNAINGTQPAPEVIRDYGTHVLVSGVIGGRGEYSCFVDKSKYTSSTDVTVSAKAAYAGGLKLSTSVETVDKSATEKFKSSTTTDFNTVGGTFDAKFTPESFFDWVNSLSKNPVLIDFTRYSLIPIYELAGNAARKAALMAAYEEYIQKSQKIIPDNVPALEVRIVPANSVEKVASDAGSKAKRNLTLYRPITDRGGEWHWLGQSGNNNQNLIIARELVPGAIAEPNRFTQAWNDAGSGRGSGYSLWNIVAPPGYRALGGLARFGVGKHDYNEPSGGEIQNLGCVHESLCIEGMIGGDIWTDKGTGASADGSAWSIVSKNGDGIGAGSFYSQGSYNRPGERVYVIKKGPRVKVVE
jgi:hypothetical protein